MTKKIFFLRKRGFENLTNLRARAIIVKIAGEIMMFAKEIQKMKKTETDRCAIAESKLDASVYFSISQTYLIFREKD